MINKYNLGESPLVKYVYVFYKYDYKIYKYSLSCSERC